MRRASRSSAVSPRTWNHATFLKASSVAAGDPGASATDADADADASLTAFDGRPTRVRDEVNAADLVIMVASAGGRADAAAAIGRACSDRRVTTTALIVGAAEPSDDEISKTLAQLRPWSLMVVIANSDDYITDMMTALRVVMRRMPNANDESAPRTASSSSAAAPPARSRRSRPGSRTPTRTSSCSPKSTASPTRSRRCRRRCCSARSSRPTRRLPGPADSPRTASCSSRGAQCEAIDRDARTLVLADGRRLPYDALVHRDRLARPRAAAPADRDAARPLPAHRGGCAATEGAARTRRASCSSSAAG